MDREWSVVDPEGVIDPGDAFGRGQPPRTTGHASAAETSQGNRHLSSQEGTILSVLRRTDPAGQEGRGGGGGRGGEREREEVAAMEKASWKERKCLK